MAASPAIGTIALTGGPAIEFEPGQAANAPQPPIPNPPLDPSPRAPADSVPRVIPLEPLPGGNDPPVPPPKPRVIQFTPDASGMLPDRPPLVAEPRTNKEVAADMSNMIETVREPEAEISLIEGQTKVIETRRELTRIVVSNPLVADVELLNDQPNSRLLNLYGKAIGTTSLTLWDQGNRPVYIPGARLAGYQGPCLADSPGLSRAPTSRSVRRARRSFLMARCPTRRRWRTSSSSCRSTVMFGPSLRAMAAAAVVAVAAHGGGGCGGGGMGGGGRAAVAGGGSGTGGDVHHQSPHCSRPEASHAARQNRRNQSECDTHPRCELALRSRAIADRLGAHGR